MDRGEALFAELARVSKLPDTSKNRRHKRRLQRRINRMFADPIHKAEELGYYGITELISKDFTTKGTSDYVDAEGVLHQGSPGVTVKGLGRFRVKLGATNSQEALELLSAATAEASWKRKERREKELYRLEHEPVISADEPAMLGNPRLNQFLRALGDRDSDKYAGPVVSLDIETGSGQRPLSIAAIKGYINKRTGEFLYTQALERYYVPQSPWEKVFNMALETHRITKDRALKYRIQQGATYPEVYNEDEKEVLLDFLKGAVVTGHNITGFDFRSLGITNEAQNLRVIDTWVAAENLGIPIGSQSLEDLYKAFIGYSRKEMGLDPHAAFDDVLAQIALFSKLYARDDNEGRDIRFVTRMGGYSYAPHEEVFGSSVVRGGYRNMMEVGNYMEGKTIDDLMGIRLDENDKPIVKPEGIHIEKDPVEKLQEEQFNRETRATALGVTENLLINLTTAMNKVHESMTDYVKSQSTPMIQYLSNRSARFTKDFLEKKGITGKRADDIIDLAGDLRHEKEMERFGDLRGYLADLQYTGRLSPDRVGWYNQILADGDDVTFTSKELHRMIRSDVMREAYDKRQARAEERAEQDEQNQIWWDIKDEYDINKYTERLNNGWRDEQYKKHYYIEKARKRGLITDSQADDLQMSAENLAGSYEDLTEATDELIEHNQKLMSIYEKMGKIKPYDVNQYLSSAYGQWQGVRSAAGGVVPSFILNPISRIGEAMFNFQEGKLAPWNAVQRTWNSGIGNVLTGALTAGMGPVGTGIGMAVTGGINALTQIGGNVAQAKMETKMLGIQNTLNTLGAMATWIATPFRLLHKATKLLIGSFSGLTGAINSFMKGGISSMSELGNPLTELTGVGYSSYEGTTMMDIASLFNKGSMNAVYEDFAKQQRAFYTLGQVNTNRLIASSLLGVYDAVYNPSTDSAGSYNSMVNRLLASMQGQSAEEKARTMYLASEIDSNLPSLLRTANLLDVTDINTLTNPKNSGMYWRPLDDDESKAFRWTQYEYGAATTQFGYSKMRLANKLWNSFGKNIYNAFNELVDMLADGKVESAMDKAVEMWGNFKTRITEIWNRLNGTEGGEGITAGWGRAFKIVGLQVMNTALEVARGIVTIWDAIMGQLLNKAQGLIGYLSTIQLEPKIGANGKISFDISSIRDVQATDDMKLYEEGVTAMGKTYLKGPAEGMASLVQLAEMYGVTGKYEPGIGTSSPTVGDLRKRLTQMHESGMPTIGLSDLGIESINTDAASVDALLDYLLRKDVKDRGDWSDVGAAFLFNRPNLKMDKQSIYNKTGIMDIHNAFTGEAESTLGAVIDAIQENNNRIILELRVTDSATGKTIAKKFLTGDESVITKNLIQLQQLVADGVDLVVQKVSGN